MPKKSKAERLASELLSLLSRYDRADFDDAMRYLQEVQLSTLFQLTGELAERASDRRVGPHRAPKPKRSAKDILEEKIAKFDVSREQKRRDIARFLRELLDRRVLSTPASLRHFLAALDWPESNSKKLDRAVIGRRLADHLDALPAPAVSEVIERALAFEDEPSSLQSWANVIVKS